MIIWKYVRLYFKVKTHFLEDVLQLFKYYSFTFRKKNREKINREIKSDPLKDSGLKTATHHLYSVDTWCPSLEGA